MTFLDLLRRITLWSMVAAGLCRAEQFNEYQVKAAFLYSFAKFVEWPPETFPSPTAEIGICVLGEDPFRALLDSTVQSKTVEGRPLTVYRLANLPIGTKCKILFIAASERYRLAAVLDALPFGVLTVGDLPEFANRGGVIGLQLEGERIRLIVNLTAAGKARLRISSRLLGLATITK